MSPAVFKTLLYLLVAEGLLLFGELVKHGHRGYREG
jgi:hypothetical protein